MNTLTNTTRLETAHLGIAPRRPIILRVVQKLIAWDRAFREKKHLREICNEHLADMGLTRDGTPTSARTSARTEGQSAFPRR